MVGYPQTIQGQHTPVPSVRPLCPQADFRVPSYSCCSPEVLGAEAAPESGEGLTFIPAVFLFVQTPPKSFVDTDSLMFRDVMLGQAKKDSHMPFHISMGHLFLSSVEVSQLLSSFKLNPNPLLASKWQYGPECLPVPLSESIHIPA